jgi:hypothetical protein
MKTNVVMQSSDRELFGITIKQQTQNKFVCVSDLQKAYDAARWKYGWSEREVKTIMQSKDFKERVYHLLNEMDFIKVGIPTFMEMVENNGITKVLKGLGVWKTTGKGNTKAVYCDPYIWVMLAMEMNPMIYAKVIIWITDTLIFDRIEAGTEFKPMNSSIKTIIQSPDYAKYAKLINMNVFGRHETGMRQLASSTELKKIAEIEKFVKNGIDCGMIKNDVQIEYVIKTFGKKP